MSRPSGRRRGLSLTLTLLSLAGSLPAQDTARGPDHVFAVPDLEADFALLRNALEEAHAGLYRYSPKGEIDRVFDAAAARLRTPMTERQFLGIVAPVVAAIHDGHTGIGPSEALAAYLDTQPILLPFGLRFVEGRAYLFQDFTDTPTVALGAEVTRLNGLAMGDVVARLLPRIPSDGRGLTGKFRRFLDRPSTFSRLYTLEFGVTTSFTVAYDSGGTSRTDTVPGITTATLEERAATRYPAMRASRPPIELTWQGAVPILTVRTFDGGAYRRAGIDYPQVLVDAFDEIARRADHLVIDVRGNGGGSDDFGKLLAAHLLEAPFDYYAALEINAPRFSFLPYTNQPNWQMDEDRVRPNARGVYDVLGHPNLGLQQPVPPVFGGDVTILIDGGSFSATGEFTSVVHHAGRATFVGEESGAGYYGNTSGGGALLTLPHTRVRVQIPFVRYTCAVSGYTPEDRGLMPDHDVTPTIEDLLAGRDPALAFAVERARRP